VELKRMQTAALAAQAQAAGAERRIIAARDAAERVNNIYTDLIK
jgi:hypothetical protein